ncbi:MAG: nitroreductase family protein [Candidatus Bathyarchaeia archaeon]
MTLEPEILRALIRERTHHTIEVLIYPIIYGRRPHPPRFGEEVRVLLDIWRERELSLSEPDIVWASRYLELAERIRRGETPELDTKIVKPFEEREMEVVKNLIFGRRSIRQWKKERVPDWMINEIIKAGLAAPNACNLQCQRFLVLTDEESMSIIKGDVPLPPVKIVICQDMRIYEWMGFLESAPQNIYFDAAAAADHMLLMAHALGLGGVWLTHTRDQAERLRKHLRLPDYYRMDTHIAVGWPDEAPIKSARMPHEHAIIRVQ